MTPNELEQKIRELLGPRLESEGLFLVDVKILPGNTIQVFADGDINISLDQCATINRYLVQQLEENKWAGDNYAVEVSSPGMDQPLKTMRQFKKRVGKKVDVLLKDGIKKTGKLVAVSDDELRIIPIDPNKIVKGRPIAWNEDDTVGIPFTSIKSTKISLDF